MTEDDLEFVRIVLITAIIIVWMVLAPSPKDKDKQ